MEYYDRVAENFLELASSQRLHILFKLMERSRKRIEPLAKEIGATKQEIHRNLVRLEQSGLITKDKDGKYTFIALGPANRVAVVDSKTKEVIKYLLVGQRVWQLAFTPDQKTLLSTNGVSNDVSFINVEKLKVEKSVKVGRFPWGVVISPN